VKIYSQRFTQGKAVRTCEKCSLVFIYVQGTSSYATYIPIFFCSNPRKIVAPWNLFATLSSTMDGSCIYCHCDRSNCTPTMTISWTPVPSSYCFFMFRFSLVVVSTLFWMSSHYFNVGCQMLHSCRVAEGLFP
jgi:hypothetical protein